MNNCGKCTVFKILINYIYQNDNIIDIIVSVVTQVKDVGQLDAMK